MIDVRDLVVRKRGTAICAVRRLSLASGERLGLVGPNGSGKSTLLRVFAGLESEFEGSCETGTTWRERTWVQQSAYMFRGTVLSNVAYGLRARGQSRRQAHERSIGWLERVGMREHASRTCTHLSAGQVRRVALARALVLEPRLLLLDEPLADLDAAGVEMLSGVLRELLGTTIVVSSPTGLPDELISTTHRLECVETPG